MSSDKKISRRKFMGAAAAAGAFTIVPRHVLGGVNYKAPSEKLNIAAIGSGGKGSSNLKACESENIVALCDVDFERAAETFKRYPKAKTYKDFRVMLDKQKDIDAVIIATPDHTHAVATMAAMKMGKHVYCQKPLTHTIREARMLTETARQMGVVTQMGNQGHSGEGCRLINEWIHDGAIGEVRDVHCWTNRPVWPQSIPTPTDTPPVPKTLDWDLWLGPARERAYNPAYLPFNWRGWYDFGCGALGDMACHVMDAAFFSLDLKYPDAVTASASYHNSGKVWNGNPYGYETFPMASIVHYSFPARGDMPPVKVHWYDGGLRPERPENLPAGRTMPSTGSIFIGDKGGIMCETYGESPRIFPEERMQEHLRKRLPKRLKRVDTSHELNWVEACKGGDPACSNFDYSGPFTEMILLGTLAVRMPNESLTWDAERMTTNIENATALVDKEYRKGWSI